MPARQRGSTVRRGKSWAARYRDAEGVQRLRGGFETNTAAREFVTGGRARQALRTRGARRAGRVPTVAELVDRFLAAHEVDPATTDKMRYELKHATRTFGDKRIDELRPPDLAAWRATLPARSRHQLFRSFRQVLEQAVTWQPARTQPDRPDPQPPGDARRGPGDPPVRVAGRRSRRSPPSSAPPTERCRCSSSAPGCARRRPRARVARHRPEERGRASVERVHSQGRTKPCKKSDRQRRRVPLRARCSRRSTRTRDGSTRRSSSRPLTAATSSSNVPATPLDARAQGGRDRAPQRLHLPAHVRRVVDRGGGAALLPRAGSWGRASTQIDATYGHLVPDNEEYLRGLLDAYDIRPDAATELSLL